MPNKYDKKKNKIFVMGDLSESTERTDLINTISSSGNCIKYISFLDAVVISDDVLYALAHNKYLNSSSVKIDIFNGYLYSYLLRLGINNVNLHNKSYLSGFDQNCETQTIVSSNCDIKKFLCNIEKKYGYDFSHYRIESISRRINFAMIKTKFDNVTQYMDEVLNNQLIFDDLFNDLIINVTDFFRNPQVFNTLSKQVLSSLDSFPNIKIWCAGCSTGEEAYSMAIILAECDLLDKSIIYATDISHKVINEAKNGCYAIERIRNAESNYSSAGGTGTLVDYFVNNGYYMQVKKNIRDKILFFQHSLLEEEVLNEFQLILCRNVLIYFDKNLQIQVLELLKKCLDRGGILILGESENLAAMDAVRFLENVDIDKGIFKNSDRY